MVCHSAPDIHMVDCAQNRYVEFVIGVRLIPPPKALRPTGYLHRLVRADCGIYWTWQFAAHAHTYNKSAATEICSADAFSKT